MKTFLKVLSVIGWTFAVVSALMGNTAAVTNIMIIDDEDDDTEGYKKKK